MNGLRDQLSIEHLQGIFHAGFAIVCLGMVALAVVFVYQPLSNQISHQQNRLALVSQLGEHQTKQIQKRDELTAQRKQQQVELEEIRKSIPQAVGVDQFMGQLEKLAQSSEVQIADYRPGASRALLSWEETSVRLTTRGRYAAFYHFLDELEQMPRRNRILSLHLNPESPEPGSCTVNLEIGIFSHPPQKIAGESGGRR